jgi:hypothetical protein
MMHINVMKSGQGVGTMKDLVSEYTIVARFDDPTESLSLLLTVLNQATTDATEALARARAKDMAREFVAQLLA